MLDEIFKEYNCDKGSTGHNYTKYYEDAFRLINSNPLIIMELGVGGYEHPNRGGQSLRAWKQYFWNSVIHGVDMYDKKALEEDRIFTHVCGQSDDEGLKALVDKIGQPNVIIDDASHHSYLTIASFNILFPLLKKGGLYIIEDTHVSYWDRISSTGENFGGGIHAHTSLNYFKRITDYLNWEEAQRLLPYVEDRGIHSMTFGKGILIIEKQ